jgi:glutamine synthetase
MKAAIYVTKKPTEGLKDQMEQAYALADTRGWEVTRMEHQDELANESKLESFYQAVQAGEFQVLAVPSMDVFSERVIEALKHFGVELEVYDPAVAERQRQAEAAVAAKEAKQKERKQAQLESMANEPWKAKLMDAFLKKGQS